MKRRAPTPEIQARIDALPTFPPSREERAQGVPDRVGRFLAAAILVAYFCFLQTWPVVGPLGHVALTVLGFFTFLHAALNG
jgi:hypothetical protein